MTGRVIALLVLTANGCGGREAPTGPTSPTAIPRSISILVFSKTDGFRHDSIPAGIAAIQQQGQQRGLAVTASEDAGIFTEEGLAAYRAVVFLSTTGDVLTVPQQAAFEQFVRRGGGFVGVHAAADTEYGWAFYGGLVGAYFSDHPAIQTATIHIEDAGHPSTASLPSAWVRRDEWYNFRHNPRGAVTVLATLDERTYSGGTMMLDHPIMWAQTYEGGRAWYTAGGHTIESFAEPLFVDHLGRAILWAAGAI